MLGHLQQNQPTSLALTPANVALAQDRAPVFLHQKPIDDIRKGHQLADVSALIGTTDVAFGEIDR